MIKQLVYMIGIHLRQSIRTLLYAFMLVDIIIGT